MSSWRPIGLQIQDRLQRALVHRVEVCCLAERCESVRGVTNDVEESAPLCRTDDRSEVLDEIYGMGIEIGGMANLKGILGTGMDFTQLVSGSVVSTLAEFSLADYQPFVYGGRMYIEATLKAAVPIAASVLHAHVDCTDTYHHASPPRPPSHIPSICLHRA